MAEVKALACAAPRELGVPVSRLSRQDLRRLVIERGLVASISGSTIWRWLDADAIRPWQYRSWLFPRDPDFAVKAGVVLDLYQRRFQGRPLGAREFVVSADEKTSIQARQRITPTLPPGPARAARVEHEYERRGSLAYLAAWDVHQARIFGRCEQRSGIEPFERLVAQLMQSAPYCDAERVFWIVDNGSAHRGRASIERLQTAWPTLRLIHLPIHASWLNQIEIYFSILQRKLLQPNDFADLPALEHAIGQFERYYAQIATPFRWTFTRADLRRLLARLASEQPTPGSLAA